MTTLSPAARQVIKAYYYALITHQDAQVGRVLAALDDAGLGDDTIVLYGADHGDLMGDFGTYFKGVFLEGSARVPFLMRGASVPRGETRMQLTGIQDVLPTLAAMTGCPLPQPVQGLDLTAALRDAAAPLREIFYGQCMNDPRQSAMVTSGRWKYCYAQMGAVEELYDLKSDPTELVNLASKGAHGKLVASWRERLIAEALRLGDATLVKDGRLVTSPLDREALKKLPIREMGWRWF
jgi:arylsulfatase A-like enzyme